MATFSGKKIGNNLLKIRVMNAQLSLKKGGRSVIEIASHRRKKSFPGFQELNLNVDLYSKKNAYLTTDRFKFLLAFSKIQSQEELIAAIQEFSKLKGSLQMLSQGIRLPDGQVIQIPLNQQEIKNEPFDLCAFLEY